MRVLSLIGASVSVAFVVILLVAGCAAFEDPSVRATENAESTLIEQSIQEMQTQAVTMVALQQTADSAVIVANQLNQVSTERANLQGTVSALQSFGGSQPQANVFVPNSSAGATPAIGVDGGPIAGPLPTTQTSSATNSGANYNQTVMATSLTTDYCAQDSATSFSVNADLVYFVTVANNINAGIRYTLRISDAEGMVVNTDADFWTSDQTYERTCIYYGIDGTNIPFVVATYRVELLADNVSVTSASFSFVE